jgi:protein-disulfide isomerase
MDTVRARQASDTSIRARQALAAGLLLAAAFGLAACSGDAMNVLDPAAMTVETAAVGGASRAPAAAFDPFSNSPQTSVPMRQVIENPTLAEVMRPGPLPEFSIGRADAPVTIIKYASLTCPYCRRFQAEVFPVLKRDYIDHGKVRFIIREFPIGKTSGMATIALRCAPMDRYLELYGRYLSMQARWVSQEVRIEPILKVAQGVGLTAVEFDRCRQNHGMIDALNRIKDRGRELGVIGTPNFFINGRLVKKALDLNGLREIIDPLIGGAAAAATPVSVPR